MHLIPPIRNEQSKDVTYSCMGRATFQNIHNNFSGINNKATISCTTSMQMYDICHKKQTFGNIMHEKGFMNSDESILINLSKEQVILF